MWIRKPEALDTLGALVGLGLAVVMLRGCRARDPATLAWGVMLSGAMTLLAVAVEVWARARGLPFTRGEALSLGFGAVTTGLFAALYTAQRRIER